MNLQEYISSGIVESYVLGLADQTERSEFESMCAKYPEVKAAREAFEISLEQQAMNNAVQPPVYIKEKILSQIGVSSNDETAAVSPVVPITAPLMDNAVVIRAMKRLRYFVAASVLLFLVSTGLNFYFFSQYKNYTAKYDNLLAQQQQLASNNNVMQAKLQSYESAIAMIKDPNVTVVKMPGSNVQTSPSPGSLATVYWDNRTKNVYLLINNMPEPATDKQYQLWALVDGKPVDAGIFDTKDAMALVKMKNITKAQAFAITLEKKGGSATPTMTQLYVLGNVKT